MEDCARRLSHVPGLQACVVPLSKLLRCCEVLGREPRPTFKESLPRCASRDAGKERLHRQSAAGEHRRATQNLEVS